MLSEIERVLRRSLLRIVLAVYYPINSLSLWIVRKIIGFWGRKGLHMISVGEFTTGSVKTRSLYREDMLLKTILLYCNLRGKSCLDLACNDGFWSFRLGRFGIRKLTGVDLGEHEIFRANFFKTVYAFPSFQFRNQDVFQFLYRDNRETYDIVLLLSLIYHLPEDVDYRKFFNAIAKINNECLVIDSRWFDNDDYWYDKTSDRTVIKIPEGVLKKWRPTRKEVFALLEESGYEQIADINPSSFLEDTEKAYGDGDPYTLDNVSDYISGNRTIVIAYKKKMMMPDIGKRLNRQFVETPAANSI